MPWWSWIVIWIALIALTLLFLIYCGFRLYRGFSALLTECGAASSVLDRLDFSGPVPATTELQPFEPAVFEDPVRMRAAYQAGKAERKERRRVKRIARRIDRGQPVAVRDLPGL